MSDLDNVFIPRDCYPKVIKTLKEATSIRMSPNNNIVVKKEEDLNENMSDDDPESHEGMDDNGNQKRRHRRRKSKRKWKPYYKLSLQERNDLEKKEEKRATHERNKRFAYGQPLAPYNTTQFLMDEHEPDYHNTLTKLTTKDNSVDSYDDLYSSSEDDEFMTKQFSEIYDNIYSERLNNMQKSELIQDYIQVQRKVEELKESHAKIISKNDSLQKEKEETINACKKEIGKLTDENAKLKSEIERLKSLIKDDNTL